MTLDIYQHRDTLLNWINSCTAIDQTMLCQQAIAHFITERFRYVVSYQELTNVENKLTTALLDRRDQIISAVAAEEDRSFEG